MKPQRTTEERCSHTRTASRPEVSHSSRVASEDIFSTQYAVRSIRHSEALGDRCHKPLFRAAYTDVAAVVKSHAHVHITKDLPYRTTSQ